MHRCDIGARAGIVIVAAAAVGMLSGAVSGAEAFGQSLATEFPRMPDGMPNFTGMWEALGTAHWDLEAHGPEAGPFFQLGALGARPAGQSVVEGGEIPYTPQARAQRDANRADWLRLDPAVKCFMPGIPRSNYMPFPFHIVQGTEEILFAYEFATANRVVGIGRTELSPVDSWMGWSNGRFEGDTLVVEVTGLNGESWFDHSGNYMTNQVKIVERFTPISPNHLEYEATIEDPGVFTRPWTIRMPLYRRVEENAQILEFKCVEFTEELLYGDVTRKDPGEEAIENMERLREVLEDILED